jgi:BirA family biotin operon repressor/biotin-[acetyl-CoA-carboxylase] ligase
MFVSVILAAPGEIARAPQLGFVAALAAIDAVQSLAPDRASDDAVKCKWPNDILLDGAKVGGILLETATGARADAWVVVGIGLNVNPVEVPDAQYPVTSLAEHGIAVGVPRLLDTFLRAFQARVARWRRDGFEPTRGEWTAHAARLGERLTVATGSGEVHGRFVGIDADGALLLERAGGAKRDRVLAGDVLR